jgi:hypothetical protein
MFYGDASLGFFSHFSHERFLPYLQSGKRHCKVYCIEYNRGIKSRAMKIITDAAFTAIQRYQCS